MDRCRSITNEFKSRALGNLFSFPIDPVRDKLDGYFDVVKTPMDFYTITNNLDNDVYKSPKEWYNDMSLVFQNAISYYDPNHYISLISKFYLQEFKKCSIGLDIDSNEEWLNSVSEATKKLTKCFSHAPSFQNVSPKVVDIKNKLDSIPPTDDREMSIYLNKLNDLGSKEESKNDLYDIFKEIGRILPNNIKTPIDITKLSSNLKKSLIQYAKDQF